MSKNPLSNPVLLLASTLAGGALFLGIWSWQQWLQNTQGRSQPQALAATVLSEPRPLPDVSLVDQDGNTRALRQLEMGWSLWFFGFTHCPDICPNTLGLLAAIKQSMANDAAGRKIQTVFVSVDPQRDTPEKLRAYIDYFDKESVGLTGSREAIDALTSSLYLPYVIHAPDEHGDYNVEHSGALVLVGPDNTARAYFTAPHKRADLIHDLRLLTGDSPDA